MNLTYLNRKLSTTPLPFDHSGADGLTAYDCHRIINVIKHVPFADLCDFSDELALIDALMRRHGEPEFTDAWCWDAEYLAEHTEDDDTAQWREVYNSLI